MVMVKAKVIGPNPVCDTHTGNHVEIDTDLYNVPALIEGGHIELSKAAEKLLVDGESPN